MRLTVDGIGKVTDTTVDLDGITVVAGPNDTGKSTIGKALFALVNSQHDFTNEFADRIAAQLTQIAARNNAGPGLDLRIFEHIKTDLKTLFADLRKRDGYGPEDVRAWFSEQKHGRSGGKDYESLCEWAAGDSPEAVEFREKCVEYIGQDESVVRRLFATQEFQGVFDEQVNSRFSIGISTASAGLEDDRWDLESTVEFESDKCVTVESRLPERTAAILIDDPQVVNDILKPQRDYFEVLFGYRNLAHMSIDEQNRDIVDSRSSGSMSKAMTDTQAEERSRIVQDILDVLGKGCDTRTRIVNGTPVMDSTDGLSEPIHLRNVSLGATSMVMLGYLLEHGILDEDTFLILDEPEIHLHPEWQLYYAETLVRCAKELGTRILLTTHSPYFMHALIIYSQYHRYDGLRIYAPEPSEKNPKCSTFRLADEERQNELLESMAKPFDILERIQIDMSLRKDQEE